MHETAKLVRSVSFPKSRVLFLGYSSPQTKLIDILTNAQCEVWHTEDVIESTNDFDLVISFGYRHIIHKNVILNSSTPIINLHISYLPWNRGSHPNFWSFFDGTPSGVSIHMIDTGVDTGSIVYQRLVNFSPDEDTFSKTQNRLIREIEQLFEDNLIAIIHKKFTPLIQSEKGSYHCKADLPVEFSGWESNIQSEIVRLKSILNKET